MRKPDDYRCEKTIDIEDYIKMEKDKKTKITIEATYKSGRVERLTESLTSAGKIHGRTLKKINDLRSFPTVERVEYELT
jgi:hypothetical protein